MELYDVPEVDGFPIAIFSERDDDEPGSGSFTDLVSLDDFNRSASLLARTDSLTQDSTFKVRVYGYMVKGLMAGKMATQTINAANDLFNLPPGYSMNNDINDPNCGLSINAVEDNIFVHCLEFRIGDEQPRIIVLDSLENNLWPYLPNQTNGLSRGANREGYNPVDRNLSVQLLQGNTPLANEVIEFKINYITGTGGHIHTNPLPENKKGQLYSENEISNQLSVTTDDNGIARIDSFKTSQVSGEFILITSLASDTTIFVNQEVTVSVPDLIDFSTISSNGKWRLTGENENHNDNHWVNIDELENFVRAINEFYAWSKSTENKDSLSISLGINDISLVNGGALNMKGIGI